MHLTNPTIDKRDSLFITPRQIDALLTEPMISCARVQVSQFSAEWWDSRDFLAFPLADLFLVADATTIKALILLLRSH